MINIQKNWKRILLGLSAIGIIYVLCNHELMQFILVCIACGLSGEC